MRGLAVVLALAACGPGQEPAVTFERVEIQVGGSPHVLAAELTGDERPDIAVAGEGRVLILAGDGNGAFRRADSVEAGENPTGLAAADLDGDGDRDLAVANHETDYLTLLLNDGDGRFSPAPGSPLRVDVEPHPHVVTAEDLDGDDRPDLLVDHRTAEGLLPLYLAADGSYVAGDVIGLGGDPYRAMVVADLNGDGVPDLATPNERTVGVRLGRGDRSFGPLRVIEVGRVAPYGLTAADVDGDGILDLAASSGEGGEGVAVLLGDGAGDFRHAPGSAVPAVRGFSAITAGDLDGDDRDDLAVTSWDSGEVVVLLGGALASEEARDAEVRGPAGPVRRIEAGENPWSVSAADFDGDGRDDLAVALVGEERVVVLLSLPPSSSTAVLWQNGARRDICRSPSLSPSGGVPFWRLVAVHPQGRDHHPRGPAAPGRPVLPDRPPSGQLSGVSCDEEPVPRAPPRS